MKKLFQYPNPTKKNFFLCTLFFCICILLHVHVVRKNMDVNGHEKLSNITLGHKLI